MIKKLALGLAAASLLASAPSVAQEEEPRTTYRIEYLSFAPGGAEEWNDAMTKYVAPARAELGFPAEEVHWLMAGEWEIMIITKMPEGLAVLDRHRAGRFEALDKNIAARIGSEEEAKAKKASIDSKITRTMVTYSHTHP